MTDIILTSNDSPFDSIRHLDENANEFWYARELMNLMKYIKWQKFKGVIEVATENLETITGSTIGHFLPVEVKSNGRPKLDYKLSRLACYHVALCCDSRGNESVKSAKHYFAIKTREAETVIPQQSERLKELELQNEVLAKQLELRRLDNTMLTMHGKEAVLALRGKEDQIIETEKPTIEVIDDRHNIKFKGQTLTQIKEYVQQKYGVKFKSGAAIKRFLESKGEGYLVAQTLRSISSDYVPEENLEQVYRLLKSDSRQMLLGE